MQRRIRRHRVRTKRAKSPPVNQANRQESSQPDIGTERSDYSDVLDLQRTIGNRAVSRLLHGQPGAVQRLIISRPELLEQAGQPQQDIDLKIFTYKMSERYKTILNEIQDYYKALRDEIISSDATTRQQQVRAISGPLHRAWQAANDYVSSHKKAIQKARQKQSKLERREKAPDPSNEQEIARYNAISQLVTDISSDWQTLRRIEQGGESVGMAWMDAMVADDPNKAQTAMSIRANMVAGDPAIPASDQANMNFRAPTYSQGKGAVPYASDPAPFAARNGALDTYKSINLKHKRNDPVITLVGANPPQAVDLYDGVRKPLQEPVPTGRQRFNEYQIARPVANPLVEQAVLNNNLFLQGGPARDDIRQGGLGDCYFLAAVSNILQTDPGKITSMMTMAGNNIEVTFHRYDRKADRWVKQLISVPNTLLASVYGLKAASFKIGAVPARSEWYASSAQGNGINNVFVHRRDQYPAALWVPFLEKAYVQFAGQFGRYGHEEADTKPTGYEQVHQGGRIQESYGIFYGHGAMRHDTELVKYDEKDSADDLVSRNKGTIERLAQMKNAGLQDRGVKKRVHLGAQANRSTHVERAIDAIGSFMGSGPAQNYAKGKLKGNYGEFASALEKLAKELESKKVGVNSARPDELTQINQAAQAIMAPASHWAAMLQSQEEQKPRVLDSLADLVANLITLGTDSSTGQRNIYSSHAYDITDVVFKDNTDSVIPAVTSDNIDTVDPAKTMITLFNTHGANTPNRYATGEEGANGVFTMSLERFIRSFGQVAVATMVRP